MGRFEFHKTQIPGLTVVQRQSVDDARGFLSRLYCADEFGEAGTDKRIAQINHTLTHSRGTVRGMHFQRPPHSEIKLVSCLSGTVFDVALDLRADSPTFLNWHGEIISAENRRALLIPEGFAHGFQALTDNCELLYLHTAPYNSDAEGALNIADPALAINWPLPASDLSERDRSHPFIDLTFLGFRI